MNNYRQMAFKYLKLNKKRCRITILGVMVAVAILYTILNLGWSRLLQQRKELREVQDYEIVFLTETAEQAEELMADDRVKSASVGPYYVYSYYEPVMYENALYINTKSPYRMEKILEELQNDYGVEGKLNKDLAETYLQGGEGNLTFILIMYVLLISYIFAILGVGIVRNAIQLSILEQIKDYGNLRCVGSTAGQLKAIVYIQGAVLELTGNALGLVVGFIASLIIGHFLKWEVGFHVLPLVPILIAFLGDLYFAMEENCKVLVNMTPVSAIRGEYRIRKEKIKARKRSIFGKLFGVEGDYAYKSIMRNPGRFHKTVWALGVGMAAFIAVMGAAATARGYINVIDEESGYYHVYSTGCLDISETINIVEGRMPPAGILKAIADMSTVTDAKRVYASEILFRDYEANFAHYTDEFLLYTGDGKELKEDFEARKSGTFNPQRDRIPGYPGSIDIVCYGYDEADMERYEEVLMDGTLDVSENGLVLVNSVYKSLQETDEYIDNSDLEYNVFGDANIRFTDYKVGDTVDIVDMGRYHAIFDEQMDRMNREWEKEIEEYENKLAELEDGSEEEREYISQFSHRSVEHANKQGELIHQCREQVIEEGAYKTYTIEGIVKRDVNHAGGMAAFVLPLDRYFALTGTDESAVVGMQYHFNMFSEEDFDEIVNSEGEDMGGSWYIRDYPMVMARIESMKMIGRGILLFVIFVVLMTTFNIINTTASNLHLRRKEFAQLRVIGISKERLMKMVMLEGVIADLVASMIGIILGTLFSLVSYGLVLMIVLAEGKVYFPVWEAVIGIVVATLITCGSIYVPLKGLKQNMAADLATGGD